jgi:hypothetical protein
MAVLFPASCSAEARRPLLDEGLQFHGPLGCTCEAEPTSKEVKSIIGKVPR